LHFNYLVMVEIFIVFKYFFKLGGKSSFFWLVLLYNYSFINCHKTLYCFCFICNRCNAEDEIMKNDLSVESYECINLRLRAHARVEDTILKSSSKHASLLVTKTV